MRPIGAPDDAVGVGCDQRLRKRDHVGVVGAAGRGAVGAGNLDIGLATADEIKEVGEAGLLEAEFGLRTTKMI